MADKTDYIAVFDSGLGGISVLRHLRQMMPGERYLYFGDSANAPYGSRSTEEVRALTLAAAEKLLCWMLGSNYQNMLMVTQCNDGQIPVNETVFHAKLENRALKALEEIYRNFRFTR